MSQTTERRRCAVCRCFLASDNTDPICSPCDKAEKDERYSNPCPMIMGGMTFKQQEEIILSVGGYRTIGEWIDRKVRRRSRMTALLSNGEPVTSAVAINKINALLKEDWGVMG